MDLAIARLAESQHGLVTTAQLARPLLSHWAAAELHGLISWRASLIDVVVPRKRQAPPGARFREANRIHWRDRTDRDDIPVTSVARLLVDLTDVVRVPHEITAVIRQAAYNGAYSLLATQDARARANGRRNIKLLDEAIELYEAGSAGTRSRGEIRALILLDAQGLPRPIVNTTFLGEEVDFHWPERKLIVELDGPAHTRPPSRRSDAERDELFRNAGYELIRVREPWDVVEVIRRGR
ncbi:DUF559 domain-containing protein [Solirubrobacter phytolaccae]|uniref:DUF559 domain-containing protein n=1 Tax=Solirubrobacter phytolaccae TaxID=1404360 RepID=A0A9X3SC26_9ACTN|nr:DUF559 domain-containing protein [Solirubrobacter phytolaccae]MDA0184206.1 DUF559 domain-containing protein [Solirubrobacter phytolaccae]